MDDLGGSPISGNLQFGTSTLQERSCFFIFFSVGPNAEAPAVVQELKIEVPSAVQNLLEAGQQVIDDWTSGWIKVWLVVSTLFVIPHARRNGPVDLVTFWL